MIDFHLHTIYSDGEFTPFDLVRLLKNNGVTTFSVTDHDPTLGLSETQKLANEFNMKFILGVEFEGVKRVHVKCNKNAIGNFPYFDIGAELKEKYTIEDLYDYINLNLKDFVINDVKIIEKLPTTGTGKIKRNKINELLNIKDE